MHSIQHIYPNIRQCLKKQRLIIKYFTGVYLLIFMIYKSKKKKKKRKEKSSIQFSSVQLLSRV